MSETGLRALLGAHREALYKTAVRLCGSPADAEDLVHEVMLRALQHEDKFAHDTNIGAWLTRILTNTFIDHCRKMKNRRSSQLDDNLASPAPDNTEPPPWANITNEQFIQAIDQLQEPYRGTYRLHAIDKLSYIDIAKRLAVSMKTVGSRMNRARLRLKALLSSGGTLSGKEPA